jgi:hypothetical protein
MSHGKFTTVIAAMLSLALLVAALWGWRRGEALASGWDVSNLAVVTWAVRCGAVALGAAAEGLLAWLVIGKIWRPQPQPQQRPPHRDPFMLALGLSAALVFMLSAASAVALGLAGR